MDWKKFLFIYFLCFQHLHTWVRNSSRPQFMNISFSHVISIFWWFGQTTDRCIQILQPAQWKPEYIKASSSLFACYIFFKSIISNHQICLKHVFGCYCFPPCARVAQKSELIWKPNSVTLGHVRGFVSTSAEMDLRSCLMVLFGMTMKIPVSSVAFEFHPFSRCCRNDSFSPQSTGFVW